MPLVPVWFAHSLPPLEPVAIRTHSDAVQLPFADELSARIVFGYVCCVTSNSAAPAQPPTVGKPSTLPSGDSTGTWVRRLVFAVEPPSYG